MRGLLRAGRAAQGSQRSTVLHQGGSSSARQRAKAPAAARQLTACLLRSSQAGGQGGGLALLGTLMPRLASPARPSVCCSMGSSERMSSIIFGQGIISCLGAGGERGVCMLPECCTAWLPACLPACLLQLGRRSVQRAAMPAVGIASALQRIDALLAGPPLPPLPAGIMCAATRSFRLPTEAPVWGALLAGGFLVRPAASDLEVLLCPGCQGCKPLAAPPVFCWQLVSSFVPALPCPACPTRLPAYRATCTSLRSPPGCSARVRRPQWP